MQLDFNFPVMYNMPATGHSHHRCKSIIDFFSIPPLSQYRKKTTLHITVGDSAAKWTTPNFSILKLSPQVEKSQLCAQSFQLAFKTLLLDIKFSVKNR